MTVFSYEVTTSFTVLSNTTGVFQEIHRRRMNLKEVGLYLLECTYAEEFGRPHSWLRIWYLHGKTCCNPNDGMREPAPNGILLNMWVRRRKPTAVHTTQIQLDYA